MRDVIKWKPIKDLTEKQIRQFLRDVCPPEIEVLVEDIEYNEILDRVEVRISSLWDTTDDDGSQIKVRCEEDVFFTPDTVKGSDGFNFTKEWQDFSIQNYFHSIYKNESFLSLIKKLEEQAFKDGYKKGQEDVTKD